jgi:hypothetical protein
MLVRLAACVASSGADAAPALSTLVLQENLRTERFNMEHEESCHGSAQELRAMARVAASRLARLACAASAAPSLALASRLKVRVGWCRWSTTGHTEQQLVNFINRLKMKHLKEELPVPGA